MRNRRLTIAPVLTSAVAAICATALLAGCSTEPDADPPASSVTTTSADTTDAGTTDPGTAEPSTTAPAEPTDPATTVIEPTDPATTSPSPSTSAAPSPATASPSPSPTTEPGDEGDEETPDYPAKARAYADATIRAWGAGQWKLVQAYTTDVAYELLYEHGVGGSGLTFVKTVDGTEPGYLYADKTNGYAVMLVIAPQKLGKPEAVVRSEFMPYETEGKTVPADPVQYADELVQAWGSGDWARLEFLATERSYELLRAEGKGGPAWRQIDQSEREGRTVVTYQQTTTGIGLEVIIDNELAAMGEPHSGNVAFLDH